MQVSYKGAEVGLAFFKQERPEHSKTVAAHCRAGRCLWIKSLVPQLRCFQCEKTHPRKPYLQQTLAIGFSHLCPPRKSRATTSTPLNYGSFIFWNIQPQNGYEKWVWGGTFCPREGKWPRFLISKRLWVTALDARRQVSSPSGLWGCLFQEVKLG